MIRGPKPEVEMARYLVRRWIFPSTEDLLGTSAPIPAEWRITTSEFRENIEWAIELRVGSAVSKQVRQLLDEIAARGVEILTA